MIFQGLLSTCSAAVIVVPAYIGPGAGFALGGSVLFGLAGFLLALVALLVWPVRALRRAVRGRGRRGRATAKRVVVLGLDGLDPILARRWMDSGDLPNLDRLRQEGGFRPLLTTYPAMSPVGWSTFATGVDASGHNIFDFLSRDKQTHLPVLSSTRLHRGSEGRRIGPFRLPGGKPHFELLRRSKPFWMTCGEEGIATSILRIPITFPPDKFGGRQLSAMCVPDLRGTQGTFSHFSEAAGPTDQASAADRTTGGERLTLTGGDDGLLHGRLKGPDEPDGSGAMTVPVKIRVDGTRQRAEFDLDGEQFNLGIDEYSPWISVKFRSGRHRVAGICKVRVTTFAPHFSFYVTPVHLDPLHPALQISNPPHFAATLARLQGPYATLGLAEDTWALNERVIDEQAFLDQAWAIHAERERHFFHALDRQPEGVVSVVFDATDRIQHMFFRTLDPAHPANSDKEVERYKDVIPELYRRADDLVGRTRERLGAGDVLLVASDHGFKTFQRGVNLNTWFRNHGYLFLKDDPATGPVRPLADNQRCETNQIDWPRTRAYTNGLAGFYLNIKGREHDGCVEPATAQDLKMELIDALRGLPDSDRGGEAITELWDSHELYKGPYRQDGPDVIVGYRAGYRADWDAAVGAVGAHVVSDNTRSWSGDHCMDPRQVPGVIFSTRPLATATPALVDLAPTVLDLLGVTPPSHMTGRSIFAAHKETAR